MSPAPFALSAAFASPAREGSRRVGRRRDPLDVIGALGRAMRALARATAILGGAVLVALVVLTCLSVAGRGGNTFAHSDFLESAAPALAEALLATGIGPIDGDFELVEAGIAFVVFASLPICQLAGAHATVDVFTARLPVPFSRAIVAFWEIVLAALIGLLVWQLAQGMLGKMRVGETTFILRFPIWWAYAASLAAGVVACAVALWCAVARVLELAGGREVLPRADASPAAAEERGVDAGDGSP